MANRVKGYGMTADISRKIDGKYDPDLEMQAVECVSLMVPDAGAKPSGKDEVHAWLKDGTILCELMNVLQPGAIKKINSSKMAFKQMENIGMFLKACEGLKMDKLDLFQTVDLYEATNMPQVISGILALGRKAHTLGKQGVGPKESEANKSNFTEDQLRDGRNVIGLQMGSNKGASQAGQSFGKARMIID
jgi:hypothetical protein